MSEKQFIYIDGSMGEGGGQIFRTALAYAAVIKQPIIIKNIRAKRKNPGLRPQHLAALRILTKITNAEVKGDFVGSKEVTFIPNEINGGQFEVNTGTAGSVTLIIQAILPALLFAKRKAIVKITGGTDVPMAPPIDTYRFVFFPFLESHGIKTRVELIKRGHYPRGGGEVILEVEPIKRIEPFLLLRQGKIKKIRGISHCVKLPKHVALRQAKAAEKTLITEGFNDIEIQIESYPPNKDPHLGPGSGIVLWAETSEKALLSADSLGAKGKPAEKVGKEAALKLIKQIKAGGAVDVNHTDYLIPFLALADGKSKIYSSEISLHTLTAIKVAEIILKRKFEVTGELGKPGHISTK